MKDKCQKILIICFTAVMSVVYGLFKLLPSQNKITFISRQSNTDTLDFHLLRKETANRCGITAVFLTRKLENTLPSMVRYFFHMFAQMYHMATSNVVVLDSYCIMASILSHKENLKIVQIWHASCAIKKFGYQTIDKKHGTSRNTAVWMKMHRNYDFVLSPSDLTSKHFCEGFNVPQKNIVKGGLPRVDYIVAPKEAVREAIRDKYPQVKSKKNVIYAPTFRKGEAIKASALLKMIDSDHYNVIVKTHPLDSSVDHNLSNPNIIFDNEYSVYDWFAVADFVISDYSALIVETALAGIPLFLYIYDLESYQEYTGLNVNLMEEPIGTYCYKDPSKLAKALGENYNFQLLHDFKKKYFDVPTDQCTQKLVGFLESLMK